MHVLVCAWLTSFALLRMTATAAQLTLDFVQVVCADGNKRTTTANVLVQLVLWLWCVRMRACVCVRVCLCVCVHNTKRAS